MSNTYTATEAILKMDNSEFTWITCKEGMEITGRGKTTIRNWRVSGELPTRESDDGVTLIPKERLLELHMEKSTRTVDHSEPGEPAATPTTQSDNGNEQSASLDDGVCDAGSFRDDEAPEVSSAADSSLEQSMVTSCIDDGQTLTTCQEAPPLEEKIPIKTISFDPETQIRERVQEKIVTDYAQKMKQGEKFPPVILFRDSDALFVGDGWHRLMAAQKNGYSHFPAQVYCGGKPAALKHALKANITHGLRLTSADKRKKVGMALREYPALSNNELANICGVSEALVRSIRDTFVKNEPEKRIGADGKAYPARKKAKDDSKKEKVLFKKTAKLAQKLTLEGLQQLKEIIEARIKSF